MRIPAHLTFCSLALAVSVGLSACNNNDSNTDTSSNTSNTTSWNFNRVASFPVCSQLDANCNVDDETSAEIVAASTDGMMLVYTDSPSKSVGFVDIADPANPKAAGKLKMGGEPTSVAVTGNYALVGVNTSADYINASGKLDVVSMSSKTVIASIEMGGQPDSVAISPDGAYAAIAIENERDEDVNDGDIPQAPAGYLMIVDLKGEPSTWKARKVDMSGLADVAPGDPEPEYVDINSNNVAAVTLQENNYIVLVNLADGKIINHFSAGSVDLDKIDVKEESPALITTDGSLSAVPREPDGVTWLSTDLLATADEGDWKGGSRGFTVFNTKSEVVFTSGNSMDHQVIRMGHYPDDRSGNKGNEAENAEFASFEGNKFLFIASERSNTVFVYDASNSSQPVLKQVLPAGSGPEGVLAIPSRNLLVAASEVDARDDVIRSVVNVYRYEDKAASYPTVISTDDANGNPVAWGALSGLAADPNDANTVYSIEDSFYQQNRIFKLDVSDQPAKLSVAAKITDMNGVFASLPVATVDATAKADSDSDSDSDSRKDVFDSVDLQAMINADKSVNIDPEGVAVASDGGFWVASEGAGTVGDATRPVNSANLVFKTDANGVIQQVIQLPAEVNAVQLRFGFEGVAEYNGRIYVAFQRAWNKEANPRIGIYDLANKTWSFVYYPLEAVASQNGGWVGLSDLTSLDNGQFLVVERDNQGGPDAAIKRLYRIDLNGVAAGATVAKTLVRDLLPDLKATNSPVMEKIEGSAVLANGDVLIVNDNDGVKDNNGETRLINLGNILK
ncbi:esterase-like activity of phytase family protein [Thiothrix nivea]|uniref:Alkaline phosphatase-like protein n=1 Tax=Thiothrix nivea (strain ATCC 35100 / DSM 5205 / JP2) TaxID=870187 RepID=A0A656HB53_THINJ|nr:esterase-like activity of phytase family protein [Thiothrix nivea]EIJ33523.1 alkaline phosphatase-like protein [Thiothrix nivea DSM 5205]